MIVRKPHYYDEFRCTASECSDNCCRGGWLIELDKKTEDYYRSLGGSIGIRITDSLITDEDGDTCFRLVGGQCPHLDSEGLCSICVNLGEEHMGVVCREFPRYSLTYVQAGTEVTEHGVGLACEAAEALILFDEGRLDITDTKADEDMEMHEDTDADEEAGEKAGEQKNCEETDTREETGDSEEADAGMLLEARADIINILEDRTRPVKSRISDVLEYAVRLQEKINEEPEEYELETSGEPADNYILLLDIYDGLERLNSSWEEWSSLIRQTIFEEEGFMELTDELCSVIPDYELLMENLMKYFIFRYYMKAVWDCNQLDKVKFAAACCIVIRQMLAALAKKQNGDVTREDIIKLVRVFSRQVEYSEDNVEAVCEEFLFGDELSAGNLRNMF